MNQTIKTRIEQIGRGEAPEGYKKTKLGLFPKEWLETLLGEYIEEYCEKTTMKNQYPVLTSARKGMMLQSEYYANNQVTTEDNIGYNVIPRGYITYRSRSDDGRFRFNENHILDKGIISYFYPVFSFRENCNKEFMLKLLNFTIYRQVYSYVEGTAQQVLSFKKLQSLRYSLPPIEEQEKIAEILSAQDRLIFLKEKRIAEKKQQKKYLMQQLLTGKKRLPGFTDEWKIVKLKELLRERKTYSQKGLEYPHVTLSNEGIYAKTERYDREHLVKSEDKEYKITHKGDICYNPANLKFGVICVNKFGSAIFSPIYVTFEVNQKANLEFLGNYMMRWDFINAVRKYEEGTVYERMAVKPEDLLNFKIHLPSIKEQQAIANILSQADKEIELLQKDLEEEKNKKKALMQLLLTGIVRAV